ncbi:MAG: hypothetical protein C4325_07040 [Blastocatellia bacterium]
MKQCLKCGRVYADADLNFCLDDGELLVKNYPDPSTASLYEEPPTPIFAEPPTIPAGSSRVTRPTGWPEPTTANASMYNPPAFAGPAGLRRTPDRTVSVVALTLGVSSLIFVCCYGGFWLGVPAAAVGFFGMLKAIKYPDDYGGKAMAVVGMILGVISFLISFLLILAGLIGQIVRGSL